MKKSSKSIKLILIGLLTFLSFFGITNFNVQNIFKNTDGNCNLNTASAENGACIVAFYHHVTSEYDVVTDFCLTSYSVDYGDKINYEDIENEVVIEQIAGYKFVGWWWEEGERLWDFDVDTVTEDITLKTYYIPRDDTKYKVQYYFQNAEDNEYILDATKTKTFEGTTGCDADCSYPTIQGFEWEKTESNQKKGAQFDFTITRYGELIVNLYYKRVEYNVMFKYYQGTNDTQTEETKKFRYGQEIKDPDITRTRWSLISWSGSDGKTYKNYGGVLKTLNTANVLTCTGELTLTANYEHDHQYTEGISEPVHKDCKDPEPPTNRKNAEPTKKQFTKTLEITSANCSNFSDFFGYVAMTSGKSYANGDIEGYKYPAQITFKITLKGNYYKSYDIKDVSIKSSTEYYCDNKYVPSADCSAVVNGKLYSYVTEKKNELTGKVSWTKEYTLTINCSASGANITGVKGTLTGGDSIENVSLSNFSVNYTEIGKNPTKCSFTLSFDGTDEDAVLGESSSTIYSRSVNDASINFVGCSDVVEYYQPQESIKYTLNFNSVKPDGSDSTIIKVENINYFANNTYKSFGVSSALELNVAENKKSVSPASANYYIFRGWKSGLISGYTLDNLGPYYDDSSNNMVSYNSGIDDNDYTKYHSAKATNCFDAFALDLKSFDSSKNVKDFYPIWEGTEIEIRFLVDVENHSGDYWVGNIKSNNRSSSNANYSNHTKISDYGGLSYSSLSLPDYVAVNTDVVKGLTKGISSSAYTFDNNKFNYIWSESSFKLGKLSDLVSMIETKALEINEANSFVSANHVQTGWRLASVGSDLNYTCLMDNSNTGTGVYAGSTISATNASTIYKGRYNDNNSKIISHVYVVPEFTKKKNDAIIANQTQSNLASDLNVTNAFNESVLGYVGTSAETKTTANTNGTVVVQSSGTVIATEYDETSNFVKIQFHIKANNESGTQKDALGYYDFSYIKIENYHNNTYDENDGTTDYYLVYNQSTGTWQVIYPACNASDLTNYSSTNTQYFMLDTEKTSNGANLYLIMRFYGSSEKTSETIGNLVDFSFGALVPFASNNDTLQYGVGYNASWNGVGSYETFIIGARESDGIYDYNFDNMKYSGNNIIAVEPRYRSQMLLNNSGIKGSLTLGSKEYQMISKNDNRFNDFGNRTILGSSCSGNLLMYAIDFDYSKVQDIQKVGDSKVSLNDNLVISYFNQFYCNTNSSRIGLHVLDGHMDFSSGKWENLQTSNYSIKYKPQKVYGKSNSSEVEYSLIAYMAGENFGVYVGKANDLQGTLPYEFEYKYFIVQNPYSSGISSFTAEKHNINLGEVNVVQNESSNAEFYVDGAKISAVGGVATKGNINIDDFTTVKIVPSYNSVNKTGYLIEEITISLEPCDSYVGFTKDQVKKITFALNYENNQLEPVVVIDNGNNIEKLKYKFSEVSNAFTEIYSILDLCNFKITAMGNDFELNNDFKWEIKEGVNVSNYGDGAVYLGFSKLVDKVKITYKEASYFDVFMKQYKNIDVDSYLKNSNLNSMTFNQSDYVSDFVEDDGLKANSWLYNTTATHIYLNSNLYAVKNLNSLTCNNDTNYFFKSQMTNDVTDKPFLVGDYEKTSVVYEKIVGYILKNDYSFISVKTDSGYDDDFKIYMTNSNFDAATFAGDVCEIDFDTYKAKNNSKNISRNILRNNTLVVKFYSAPSQFTLKYGKETEQLYYDTSYSLKNYVDVVDDSYKTKTGYSFVGWVSSDDRIDGVDTSLGVFDSSWGYLIRDEKTLAQVVASQWNFNRNLHEVAIYSPLEFKDFYVDGAKFVTDVTDSYAENYNFWSIYSFNNTITLYPVWMANDYVLKFDLRDYASSPDGQYGTTETLFRINNIASFGSVGKYLSTSKGYYNADLYNGFNYKLFYDESDLIYNKIKLVQVDTLNNLSDDEKHDFYVFVRFDTNKWFISNSEAEERVYLQDFLLSDGTVNADRYGYTLAKWIFANGTNEVVAGTIPIFNSLFYNKCNISNDITITFDYVSNPNSLGETDTNRVVYTYGKAGKDFDIDKAYVLNDILTYEGAKLKHFVTCRITNGLFRTVDVSVNWASNDYNLKIDNSKYVFANDSQGNVKGTTNLLDYQKFNFDNNNYAPGADYPAHIFSYLTNQPYRHGYEFAGWTFAYMQINDSSKEENKELFGEYRLNYQNYWHEQLKYTNENQNERVYVGLCNDLLNYYNYKKPSKLNLNATTDTLSEYRTPILFYMNAGTEEVEELGDGDRGKTHHINLYSNWTPMLMSVEIDLNIPDGYADVVNEIVVGLMKNNDGYSFVNSAGNIISNQIIDDKKFVYYNVSSHNFMENDTKYSNLVANFSFKIFYGDKLSDAFIEIEVGEQEDPVTHEIVKVIEKFTLKDLLIKINNCSLENLSLGYYNESGEFVYLNDISNLNNYLYSYFPENWHDITSYGYVSSGGEMCNLYKDVIIEKTNDVNIPYEFCERIYYEKNGRRVYITPEKDAHIDFDNDNELIFDYDDEYLYIIVDQNNLISSNYVDANGNEFNRYAIYRVYKNGTDLYYVQNAYKDLYKIVDDKLVLQEKTTDQKNHTASNIVIVNSNFIGISGLNLKKNNLFTLKLNWNIKAPKQNTLIIKNDNNNNNQSLDLAMAETEFCRTIYYDDVLRELYLVERDSRTRHKLMIEFNGEELLICNGRLMYNGFEILSKIDIYGNYSYYIQKVNEYGFIIDNEIEQIDGTFKIYVDVDGQKQELYFNSFHILPIIGKTERYFAIETDRANDGLGGYYYNYSSDSGTSYVTFDSQTQNNVTSLLENRFTYGKNVSFSAIPFYNGRYITEIVFETNHLFESYDQNFKVDGVINSTYSYLKNVTISLVFDTFFDTENRTVGIASVKLFRSDEKEPIYTIYRKSNLTGGKVVSHKCYFMNTETNNRSSYDYLYWWRNINAIDIENSNSPDRLLDFIEKYFNGIYSSSDFITVGDYVDLSDGDSKIYGREDINVVNLNIDNLKTNMTIKFKYSVQTFSVDMYNVLNEEYNKPIKNIAGEKTDLPFADIATLNKNIETKTSTLSSEYRFANSTPKFITIINDSNGTINDGVENDVYKNKLAYNVPYGYLMYGYRLDSSLVGERPIDLKEDSIYSVGNYYGFDKIYFNGNYYYSNSNFLVNSKNSDKIINGNKSNYINGSLDSLYSEGENKYLAQNAPIFGDPNKFVQSIRPDINNGFYNFGGLFYLTDDGKFLALSESDEKKLLNNNITVYAYYYIKTSTSEVGIYVWDDATSSYKLIRGEGEDYYYSRYEIIDDYYILNDENKLEKVKDFYIQKDLDIVDNSVLYTFKELGIDTEGFAQAFNKNLIFEEGMSQDVIDRINQNYISLLEKIAETYWFICYDGVAKFDVDCAGLEYVQNDIYSNGTNNFALNKLRNSMLYGATLFKKIISGGKTVYEIISRNNMNKIIKTTNPSNFDSDDYVLFNNYYVYTKDEEGNYQYYPINFYYDGAYYDPLKEYSIDYEGNYSGNNVEINGKIYYFNYKSKKLYDSSSGMMGEEVTDFKYEIVCPVNENYDIKVAERTNGYNIYSVFLTTIPDSSVGHSMPNKNFLCWATLDEEDMGLITRYDSSIQIENGLIYNKIMNSTKINALMHKTDNPDWTVFWEEVLRPRIINILNEKLENFTFKDLIKHGVTVKNINYIMADDGVTVLLPEEIESVELEFTIDLGNFGEVLGEVIGTIPVNITYTLDKLSIGDTITSRTYVLEIFE